MEVKRGSHEGKEKKNILFESEKELSGGSERGIYSRSVAMTRLLKRQSSPGDYLQPSANGCAESCQPAKD